MLCDVGFVLVLCIDLVQWESGDLCCVVWCNGCTWLEASWVYAMVRCYIVLGFLFVFGIRLGCGLTWLDNVDGGTIDLNDLQNSGVRVRVRWGIKIM